MPLLLLVRHFSQVPSQPPLCRIIRIFCGCHPLPFPSHRLLLLHSDPCNHPPVHGLASLRCESLALSSAREPVPAVILLFASLPRLFPPTVASQPVSHWLCWPCTPCPLRSLPGHLSCLRPWLLPSPARLFGCHHYTTSLSVRFFLPHGFTGCWLTGSHCSLVSFSFPNLFVSSPGPFLSFSFTFLLSLEVCLGSSSLFLSLCLLLLCHLGGILLCLCPCCLMGLFVYSFSFPFHLPLLFTSPLPCC